MPDSGETVGTRSMKAMCEICAKTLQNRPHSTESIESVETHQRLDLPDKTGKPSRIQAIVIIGLLELLRRGLHPPLCVVNIVLVAIGSSGLLSIEAPHLGFHTRCRLGTKQV